jgi:hypothetical protein
VADGAGAGDEVGCDSLSGGVASAVASGDGTVSLSLDLIVLDAAVATAEAN